VHADAGDFETTDWAQIVALYDLLLTIHANPAVELNRAVAVSMHRGPDAGLAIVDSLAGDRQLTEGHRWHSVRAQLLERLGRTGEAHDAYLRAARLTTSLPHVRFLNERANRLAPPMSGS
jgi:predicted RNA polymerase sigma factor